MIKQSTRGTGRLGENIACEYLEKNGYTVVARNIYLSHNEIDIIAEDENFIVFVEVKSRMMSPHEPDRFGRPANAVSLKKRQNILKGASEYLRRQASVKRPRIDVIEVYIKRSGTQAYEIRHIRNAFGA